MDKLKFQMTLTLLLFGIAAAFAASGSSQGETFGFSTMTWLIGLWIPSPSSTNNNP